MNATHETARTFADDIALQTRDFEPCVNRFEDNVEISWPIWSNGGLRKATISRLAAVTGIDSELFHKSIMKGRIYLDMPIEIADAS